MRKVSLFVQVSLDGFFEGPKKEKQRLDKMALRSELLELKARVDGLQDQIRTIEARLGD